MARRRVNTKFLVILTLVAAVALAIAIVAPRIFKDDPTVHITEAESLMQQGDYVGASEAYQRAIAIKRGDPALIVAFGDAIAMRSLTEREYINAERGYWNNALEFDPNYMPALTRLYEAFKADFEALPRPVTLKPVQEFGRRIVEVDPSRLDVKSYIHAAHIRAAVLGQGVTEQEVDTLIGKLEEIAKEDPANAENPYWIARALIHRAADRYATSRRFEAEELINKAAETMKAALDASPENPGMLLRSGSIQAELARLAQTNERRQELVKLYREHVTRAYELVKAEDPRYVEITQEALEISLRERDYERAEKIARKLLETRPDDQNARLLFAAVVKNRTSRNAEETAAINALRAEAIELLSKPVTGSRASEIIQLRNRTRFEIALLRIEHYGSGALTEQAARDALMKEIEDGVQEIVADFPDHPATWNLRGNMYIVQNRQADAIQALSRALSMMEQAGGYDIQLAYRLANLYVRAGETGQARTTLNRILDQSPNAIEPRMLLIQLYLQENNIAEAERHLQMVERILDKSAAEPPGLVQMRIAIAQAKNQTSDAAENYARLPETTEQEMRLKAQVALGMRNFKEAARLLEMILAQKPEDVRIIQTLARVYVTLDQRDKAVALVAEARKAMPDNNALEYFEQVLKNASPEELQATLSQSISEITDPFDRAIAQYELALQQGKAEDALNHLLEAEKIRPEDTSVHNLLFEYYLRSAKWTEAQKYLDKLVSANADQSGGLVTRIRYHLAKNELPQALSLARELTEKMPEFSRSWLLLAQSLHASGQIEEAILRYGQALEKQSSNIDALRGMIDCQYRLNQPAEAKRYIDTALRIHPNNAYFQEVALNHEMNFGDPEKVIAVREEMHKRNPNNADVWNQLAQTYVRSAISRVRKDDAEKARQYFERAGSLYAGAVQKWPDDFRFYAGRVEIALLTQNPGAGEQALRELLAREAWKQKPEPFLLQADFYIRLNRLPDGEKALRQALALSNNAIEVQIRLSNLLMAMGRPDEALAALASEDDPNVLAQKVSLLINMRRFDQAEQVVLAALNKQPKSLPALRLLQSVYLNANRVEDAEARIAEALAIEPDDIQSVYHQGLARMRRTNPDIDGAIQSLLSVRNRQPSNVDARFFLAQAYLMKRDQEAAIQELFAAIEAMPANKIVRMRLIELCMASNPPRWRDVERLLTEAKAQPALASDPDFARIEATMWSMRGDFPKAITAIQTALTLAPNHPAFVQQYLDILLAAREFNSVLQETDKILQGGNTAWWIHRARGIAQKNLGQRDKAMAEFELALTASLATGSGEVAAAVVETIAREIGAREALDRVLKLAEADSRWRIVAAYLYQALNDYDNAIATIESVLAGYNSLDPRSQDNVLRLAGVLYMGAPQPYTDKAQDMYLRLLEKYPRDLVALNNLACLLADYMNQPDKARIYSQRAYEVMSETGNPEPLILDTHGWVLTLCNEVDQGIGLIRQAIEKRPFLEAHYHLGEAYLRKSNPDLALEQFAAAGEFVARAEQNKTPVDRSLVEKLDAATARAREMKRQQAEAKVQ